jgi:flagellar protein FlbD
MVRLTKLNGDKLFLNEAWIESVEAVPDTTITFNSGNKVIVLERMETVLEEILRWQVSLRSGKQSRPPSSTRRKK